MPTIQHENWFVIVEESGRGRTLVNLLQIEQIKNVKIDACELVFVSGEHIKLIGTQARALMKAFEHVIRFDDHE